MVPGRYNIKIFKGATWSISVEAKNALEVDMDFSDYDEIRLQIGLPFSSPGPALLTMTLENGRIALANTNQTLILTLTAAETAALEFNEGVYELELIKDAVIDPPTARIVDRLLYGSVNVVNESV